MSIFSVFLLLGGLGMFLFGMKIMSDGLENAAGDRMRRVLEVLTGNRFAAVGVGAGITAIIQSSSATTVMVVGFVNAGLMSLLQATGVIMGANIGTTITSQLIAFKLSDIAPLILFVGMLFYVFIRKRSLVRIGEIVLGFGILFMGLSLMSDAMEPLREMESFRRLLVSFKNPLIGILFGALVTAIIQSSSASIGILQALATLELVSLDSGVYVILGMNIGTCITAILASIGTSVNGKRAAGIHLMIKIIGTVIYLVVLALFPSIVSFVASLSPDNVSRQIANFHTIYNVTVTIVLFPFVKAMVWLIMRIIPEKHASDHVEQKLVYLSERTAQTPGLALTQTLKELSRMGEIAAGNLDRSLQAFFNRDEQAAYRVIEIEKTIDYLSHSITNYMIEFRGLDLSEHDLKTLGSLHHVVIDMERIGDLAENIAEYTLTLMEKRANMTSEAESELRTMAEKTQKTLRMSLDIFDSRDKSRLPVVDAMEQEVDIMKKSFTNNHIDRLQLKACDPQAGVVFTNMVATLERVADHATNIAFSTEGWTGGV
jgi:phosphate:Na+ symporter